MKGVTTDNSVIRAIEAGRLYALCASVPKGGAAARVSQISSEAESAVYSIQ